MNVSLASMRRTGEHEGVVGQGGFTIIEGMIALIILAVGLLAIAGMIDMALTRNVDSRELGLATDLATDMMERIRFNRANVSAYNLIDTSQSKPSGVAAQPMASGDYDQWVSRLAASGLDGARGQVTVTAVGPQGSSGLNQSMVAVTVRWTKSALPHAVTFNTVVAPE